MPTKKGLSTPAELRAGAITWRCASQECVMNHWDTSASVVVGVDGSVAALNAAKWAVAEAKSRGAPLRLVHVIAPKRTTPRSRNDIRWAMQRGQDAVRYARAAVAEADNTVRVETEVRCGSPAEVLLDESYGAAMI